MGVIAVPVRVILQNKFYFIRVFSNEFFYGRTGRSTMGSLEVKEFDNSDRRICGSEIGAIVNRDRISLFSSMSKRRNK